jgi:hypothetical protein
MIEIDDIRTIDQFKSVTFSGFKRDDVGKEFINSLLNDKLEESCYWTAELISSGSFNILWASILHFMSIHINILNPKLPIFISNHFDSFKAIINGGYINNELLLRNNEQIRKLFGEITCILCLSKKKQASQKIAVDKTNAFSLLENSNKLKATNIEYIQEYFTSGDAKDIFVALNEFTYHISNDSKNSLEAFYWIEWLLHYESQKKKQKQHLECATRNIANVSDKYKKDYIWIIWEIILDHSEKNKLTKMIVNSLLNLFSIHYTPAIKKKRKHILYFAISLIIDIYDTTIPIVNSKYTELFSKITNNSDMIYAQIKKNEKASKTSYLFNNIEKPENNLKDTLSKLAKMKLVDNVLSGHTADHGNADNDGNK